MKSTNLFLLFTLLVARSAPSHAQITFQITKYCSKAQIQTDITQCGQAAIDAAGASVNVSFGGGVVHFPADLSPYVLRGTLTLGQSFVSLAGDGPQATYIECANGSADCIDIGTPNTSTRDQSITNMAIEGNGAKTGGANIGIMNAYNVLIQRAQVEYCVTCFNIETGSNSVTLRDIIAVPNQSSSQYGIYWHAPGDGSARSDVLILDNVVINGQWSNATGILWDGLANTLKASHLVIMDSNYGLRITNSSGSSSYYPAFLNAFDLEMEGFKTRALSIEGGNEFKIVGSDISNASGSPGQGNADDVAVLVLADAGASYTRGVSITGTRIGGSRSSGILSGSRDLQLSNDVFYTTSYAGANTAPVIELGATTNDAILTNIECEEFGGAGLASYCLKIDQGATGVLATNVDARYVQQGTVLNSGGGGVSAINLMEPNGTVQIGTQAGALLAGQRAPAH
jgi:hypothetical protein